MKKQIKEAKELKRQEKKANSGKVQTASVVKQLFDGTEVATKKPKLQNSDEINNDEDDLLVVKAYAKETPPSSSAVKKVVEMVEKTETGAKKKKSTKIPKLKISLDGELKGAKGKKIVFTAPEEEEEEESGDEVGVVGVGEESQRLRMERHAVELKERIDRGRKEVQFF